MSKLIVLRGNSGSGKTSVAKELQTFFEVLSEKLVLPKNFKKSLDMVQC